MEKEIQSMPKNALELLLGAEPRKPQEKTLISKLLSKDFGEDFLIKLRGVDYEMYKNIISIQDQTRRDEMLISHSMVEPNLKDKKLQEKYGASTPADLVSKIFYPGEVVDIRIECEKLIGMREDTLEEFKKK